MSVKVELAFLWHMHQPPYRDPASGQYILPWVRLHATRAYHDMAAIHARFPEVHGTVNFVPSLLAQLEDYAAGTARDRFLDLTVRPAAELDPAERAFVLRNFFMVNWEHGVRPLPRYWELLHKRGRELKGLDLGAVARTFSVDELRDVQLLFNLAWMGFAAHDQFEVVRALKAKGRNFDEGEKAALLAVQRAIVAGIEPQWRALQDGGSVELSSTAYYHPILPLLCDSDSARVALPEARLPPRLRAPDDAREQVHRAREKHAAVFGRPPMGMWPAEGSVSPEALAVFAAEDVSWVASDEEVLMRSLPAGARKAQALYRPWRVRAGDRELSMVFRDRGLSDLIGFSFAGRKPKVAVDELLGHLGRIGDGATEGVPLVSIILDGENPWESYPDSGRHFLTELFGRLSAQEGGVRTCRIGERVRRSPDAGRIEKIHSGSWIEANFRIWMGDAEDVAAWALVGEVRRAIEGRRAAGLPRETLAVAREHLLAAEASDWYWWYGPDFATESAAEFDSLFRGHIVAAFRALGLPPPDRALSPISARALTREDEAHDRPVGLISPVADGELGSWISWQGAGRYRLDRERGGAMHQGHGPFRQLFYGFDLERLQLRLDPAGPPPELASRVDTLRITLRSGEREQNVGVRLTSGQLLPHDEAGAPVGAGGFRVIVGLSLPFSALGLRQGSSVALAVEALHDGALVERIPRHGWLTFQVPDEDFERVHWKV